MLIEKLNTQKGNLLPAAVKENLKRRLSGKGLSVRQAQRELLRWTFEAMPEIARHHDTPENSSALLRQVTDSIQHYRFGFVQAEKLLQAADTPVTKALEGEREMVALFTAVHDLGRMMVGSGASAFCNSNAEEGNLLHPIVGAIMLREAFQAAGGGVDSEVGELLNALIITAERHTGSIGLHSSLVVKFGVKQIDQEPYSGYQGSLFMAEASRLLEKYAPFAHLVGLADLINNVSVAKLGGTLEYLPDHPPLLTASTDEAIQYLMAGPGEGAFEVAIKGAPSPLSVRRLWRMGEEAGVVIGPDNVDQWLSIMEKDSTRYYQGAAQAEAKRVFGLGLERGLGAHI